MTICRSEPIKFTIPIAPVTKKNHSQIVRNGSKTFLIPSKQYREYEESAMLFMPKIEPICRPCEVRCLFFMPTKRRVDLVNLLAAIDDILVKAGVLSDDNCNIVSSHDGSRVDFDKNFPRTEITISEIKERKEF